MIHESVLLERQQIHSNSPIYQFGGVHVTAAALPELFKQSHASL